ncbi:hypothetical protein [Pontixanthobacter gangjinensis]|uniref:Uncharacterized protein n=1 Tax=Pontixanthobacter gangjinensis TaxID=1028742 RepID=A0A6I4SNS5_9SPHN|nr:hypothetical protein [Pontixanthobacter gangjinensis]MXO57289.1 hypothetical protein [Pontixanthobacter gangjinensis]
MPDDAPPRLVAGILPKLQEQNTQILALLENQTRLIEAIIASPPVDRDAKN